MSDKVVRGKGENIGGELQRLSGEVMVDAAMQFLIIDAPRDEKHVEILF